MDSHLSFLVEKAKEEAVYLVAAMLSVMVWTFVRRRLITHRMQLALPFLDKVCPDLIEKGLRFLLCKAASAACNIYYMNGLKDKITHCFKNMMHRQPEQQSLV